MNKTDIIINPKYTILYIKAQFNWFKYTPLFINYMSVKVPLDDALYFFIILQNISANLLRNNKDKVSINQRKGKRNSVEFYSENSYRNVIQPLRQAEIHIRKILLTLLY